MLKKFLASGLVLCAASVAFGQATTLVRVDTAVTTGADVVGFNRNSANPAAAGIWSYDVRIATGTSDWTGSELTLDVVGAGVIWHASDERVATSDLPGTPDPNDSCYAHNLNTPNLVFGAAGNANSRMYDTFFTSPGARFTVDPSFASPGVPSPNPAQCPANPPIVSTSTRLRGLNPSGVEIPLAWFDSVVAATGTTNGGAALARLSFQVPAGNADLEVLAAGSPAPADKQLFAVIRGRTTTNLNSDGVGFGFDIYQTPEPSTMALLALGGLAGLFRRR